MGIDWEVDSGVYSNGVGSVGVVVVDDFQGKVSVEVLGSFVGKDVGSFSEVEVR